MKVKERSKLDQKPKAWIVNPKDRGRKSIKKDNKVYLHDGQNFEIEIFNPLKDSVLADIKVNGKTVSSTGLIIRPGERFYLDCFVDDRKKFIYKTYFVENTDVSQEAIYKNGLVEVFFYREETIHLNNWTTTFIPVIERRYYPYFTPYQNIPYWYGTTLGNTCTINGMVFGNNTQLSSHSSNVTYTNNSLITPINYSTTYTSSQNSNIETGRIEKGEKSSQKFDELDMEFEKYHISSVTYHILPDSQKPVETKELLKKFCPDCGGRVKDIQKFCSQCGHKL